jgi:hypothetical protein
MEAPKIQPRHPLRNPGCVVALIIWFVVLLSPCFMIVLAVRGEISIPTGGAPEQRLRIWLIQEARQSGIGMSSASVQQNSENLCVQTTVSFILWRGEAEPTQYCECYAQSETGWQPTLAEPGACPQP